MKIIVDNQKSKIITENKKLLEALQEHFSFYIPGYQHIRANYRFDGKKYFVTKSGYFKTGLLTEVLSALQKVNVEPELMYKEVDTPSFNKDNLSEVPYKLYDYQNEALDFCLTNKRAVIKSPTGSGKTLIMAALAKCFEGEYITILFNSKQILVQTLEFFKSFGVKDLGVNFGMNFQRGKVMLSTVQSIEKIIDDYVAHSKVLIVDEVHEFSKGKVTLAAVESFPKATYRFGFTATPPKEKIYQYNLIGALGPIYTVRTVSDLIEQDKITKPIINCIEIEYPDEDFQKSFYMAYQTVYDLYVIKEEFKHNYISNLVKEISQKTKQSKTMILVKNLDHMKALHQKIPGSITIEGIDYVEERYKKISEFLSNEHGVLIGTKVIQTGVNIQEITHFINATEIKSEIATIQALGRALRKHETKPVVYVYDIGSSNLRYLNKHRVNRISSYKKDKHEIRKFKITPTDPTGSRKNGGGGEIPPV